VYVVRVRGEERSLSLREEVSWAVWIVMDGD
jgi:hypothetical protein